MADERRLGEILVAYGIISENEAQSILSTSLQRGERFASTAVQTEATSEEHALQALATKSGVPGVDLRKVVIPKTTLERIPQSIARKERILPLRCDGTNLHLAMADPEHHQTQSEVAFATGLHILPYVALVRDIDEAVETAYGVTTPYYIAANADPAAGDDDGYIESVSAFTDDEHDQNLEFEISFDEEDKASVEAPKENRDKGDKKTVLVIDDEADILRLVSDTIKAMGHRVITASRGLEGLNLIRSEHPDLVIVDAMLPEVHGFEICRKIKESNRFNATPIIMISAIYRGWRMAADIKALYKVDVFLEKPFRIAELRRNAETLLETSTSRSVSETEDASKLYEEAVETYRKEDYKKSFELLRKAEGLDPFTANIQFMMARALEKIERPFQAIYHYERAVELDPSMFSAAKNLALLYQTKGFRNKSIEMWERSLDAAPNAEIREKIKQHIVSIL